MKYRTVSLPQPNASVTGPVPSAKSGPMVYGGPSPAAPVLVSKLAAAAADHHQAMMQKGHRAQASKIQGTMAAHKRSGR